MKHQALFSSKAKSKTNECRLLQLLGALRVKDGQHRQYLRHRVLDHRVRAYKNHFHKMLHLKSHK